MFSSRFLWKASVYVAVGGMTSVMIMRSILKDRVRQSEFYRESMKILRSHEGAKFILGEPIKDTAFDISDPNFCNANEAYFEVKVRGSKTHGKIFFWAKKNEESPWIIEKMELQPKGEERRLVIRKSNETESQ